MQNHPRQQINRSHVRREKHNHVSREQHIKRAHVEIRSHNPENAESYASVDVSSYGEAAIAEALQYVTDRLGVRSAPLRQPSKHQVDWKEENNEIGAEPAGEEGRPELVRIFVLLFRQPRLAA